MLTGTVSFRASVFFHTAPLAQDTVPASRRGNYPAHCRVRVSVATRKPAEQGSEPAIHILNPLYISRSYCADRRPRRAYTSHGLPRPSIPSDQEARKKENRNPEAILLSLFVLVVFTTCTNFAGFTTAIQGRASLTGH